MHQPESHTRGKSQKGLLVVIFVFVVPTLPSFTHEKHILVLVPSSQFPHVLRAVLSGEVEGIVPLQKINHAY